MKEGLNHNSEEEPLKHSKEGSEGKENKKEKNIQDLCIYLQQLLLKYNTLNINII